MSLKEQIYSVLVVSASQKFNAALSDMLPEAKYRPVHIVSSVNAAKQELSKRSYDFVLINSPLPDDSGLQFAVDTCLLRGTAVLLFAKSDIHDTVFDQVAEHGVFTLPKPTPRAMMQQALGWLASARERLRQTERSALSIREKMEEIRFVNQAKLLLISELKMSEPDAHHYIQKQAMDNCISRKEVAQMIIETQSGD